MKKKAFYFHGSIEDVNSLDYTSICNSGEVTSDHYNLPRLVRSCDSSHVQSDEADEISVPIADRIAFFVRTATGNYIVTKDSKVGAKQSVFYADTDKMNKGDTLNDCMLIAARGLLSTMFPDYELSVVGANSAPTPFGAIREDDKITFLFQLVVSREVLKTLAEGYSYTEAKSIRHSRDFHIIHNQFVYTEEKDHA